MPEAPRWDAGGWCPSQGTSWNQPNVWAPPFDTAPRGEVYYGPGSRTDSVPPEVLAASASYLDYVKASTDKGTGDACLLAGECCMDVENQRAGSWVSCPGGCENAANPDLVVGSEPRTDVEGCCWWGRGVIQTTGEHSTLAYHFTPPTSRHPSALLLALLPQAFAISES